MKKILIILIMLIHYWLDAQVKIDTSLIIGDTLKIDLVDNFKILHHPEYPCTSYILNKNLGCSYVCGPMPWNKTSLKAVLFNASDTMVISIKIKNPYKFSYYFRNKRFQFNGDSKKELVIKMNNSRGKIVFEKELKNKTLFKARKLPEDEYTIRLFSYGKQVYLSKFNFFRQ